MKLTKKYIIPFLPKREKDANKGTFGKVLVIAGSENYPGAAYLCCAACYRVGAGLVTLATIPSVKTIVSRKLPEATFLSRDEIFEKLTEYNVLLLGPGLGQNNDTVKFVNKLLKKKTPKMVIDGDGLNILSKIEKWDKMLKNYGNTVVLTPHPGEMARLTGLTVEDIQSDRENIAKKNATFWGQTVILKGANTVIGSPAGRVVVSPFANPILATAGTGDVLSGIIAGLIAHGLELFEASCVGIYVHGLSGELLSEKKGNAGALASELLFYIPSIFKNLRK